MDVTCATCGEPWDTHHLRHDEVHETEAGDRWVDYRLDCEDWEKSYGDDPKPSPPPIEKWEGKLTPFWREQFKARGWEFGGSIYVVLRCSCCKVGKELDNAEERRQMRSIVGELLEGDDDGIAATLEDLSITEGR